MEKKHIFTGAATALVTPMNESGVDYEALGKLIDWQIAAGIKALVVCATTGEAPTLTDNEHCKVLEFAIARSGHRVPIIAGTGSNDTAHAIMMTQFACTIGADENQKNLQWFLNYFPFRLESIDSYICDELKSRTTRGGYIQLLPGVHDTDGFFIARLRRLPDPVNPVNEGSGS